jgi:hypothetical protein
MAIARCDFPRAARTAEDRAPTLGHELRAEKAPQHLQLERGLEGEVEVIDRAEERKLRLPHRARQARLAAVRDLLGDQRLEIRVVAHPVRFRAGGQLGIQPPDGREVQTPEHAVEIMDWRGRRTRQA